MALVKRPGSAESRLAPYESSPAAELQHLIDITTMEAARMARKKVTQTGTYEINGGFYRFMEGDEFPEGTDPKLVEKSVVATADTNEERGLPAAPENRAKQVAPEKRTDG